MFSKLALRNVRRSFRDYGVYLLTLTFGVCLFYTFNSIDGQGVMVYLAQSQNPMAQLIQTILDIFSVFVAVVLACLILYANTFLIRRRKRELGTSLLLGLPGAEPIHPAPVAEQGPLHLPVHDGHLHPAAAGRRHHRQLHRTQLHLGGGGR